MRLETVEEGAPPGLPNIRGSGGSPAEWCSALLGLGFGGFLAVLVLRNSGSEPIAASYALALEYCTPGLLALLARRRRPALYLAGGILGTLLAFTSIGALPLLIPAWMAFVAYSRRAGDARGRVQQPVVALMIVVLALAAFAAQFVHQDPGCRTGPNWSECFTNEITTAEGSLALSLVGLTIVAGFALAAPRREHGA